MEESRLKKLIKQDKHLKSFAENNLSEDDKIISLLRGYIGKVFSKTKEDHKRNGILICTNNLVAFHSKGIFNNTSRSIAIKNISSIDIDKVINGGKIAFRSASDSILVSGTDLDQAKKFKLLVEKIRDTPETSKTSVVAEDPIDKIKRLSQLKDDGIISEQEFEETKGNLLKEI